MVWGWFWDGLVVLLGSAVIKDPPLQSPRFSTQEGVSVRYLGAISRTSRSSSRTTFRRVQWDLVGFKKGYKVMF